MLDYGLEKNIANNVFLAPHTTMRIGGVAKYFIRVQSEEVVPEINKWASIKGLPVFILGGGSNLVVSDDGFPGLVIKMEIRGIKVLRETKSEIEVTVAAGEEWDSFVQFTVKKGWWGAENMSLIPGTVGAVAVQNVGAYGQEVCKIIRKLRAFDTHKCQFVELENKDCDFGFRKSIFNTSDKGRYIIVSITFFLSKIKNPCLSRYDIVFQIKKNRKIKKIDNLDMVLQSEIRDAVVALRTNGKLLPSLDDYGNSGTFFRASLISKDKAFSIIFNSLKNKDFLLAIKIFMYRIKYASNISFKLPSNLLIKSCGCCDVKYGNISLMKKNCAVIINSGNGTAKDILKAIYDIRNIVYRRTGVVVPVEPTLVGFSDDEIKHAFFIECSSIK